MIRLFVTYDIAHEILKHCKTFDLFSFTKNRRELVLLVDGQQKIMYRLGNFLMAVYTKQIRQGRGKTFKLIRSECEFLHVVLSHLDLNSAPFIAHTLNQYLIDYDKTFNHDKTQI